MELPVPETIFEKLGPMHTYLSNAENAVNMYKCGRNNVVKMGQIRAVYECMKVAE